MISRYFLSLQVYLQSIILGPFKKMETFQGATTPSLSSQQVENLVHDIIEPKERFDTINIYYFVRYTICCTIFNSGEIMRQKL